MAMTRIVALALVAAGVMGCTTSATPVASQPVGVALNATPLVTAQSPAGTYDSSGPNLPFQSENSLPPGASNKPPQSR
jgi:hypothetical protein